jgi:aspartate kinase
VPRTELAKARKVLQGSSTAKGGVTVDEDIAKVSIVGVGMKSHSGVAYRMFEALAKANINISMIATSEIKISVVIKKDKAMQGHPGAAQGVRVGQEVEEVNHG